MDQECNPIEATAYGGVGILLLFGQFQLACLRGCRVFEFKKSINSVTQSLWAVQMLIFLTFWTMCQSTESSVEVSFWMTLLVRFHIIRNARIENVGKSQSCMVSKLRIIWKQQQLALDPSSRQALELLQRNARGNGPREILQQIESAEGVDSVTRMHAQRAGFALRLDEEAATRPRHAGSIEPGCVSI